MNEAEIALAKRLVAHPNWCWVYGMAWGAHPQLNNYDARNHGRYDFQSPMLCKSQSLVGPQVRLPDLTDLPTAGAMLALFPGAVVIEREGNTWLVDDEASEHLGVALAKSLLLAWGETL